MFFRRAALHSSRVFKRHQSTQPPSNRTRNLLGLGAALIIVPSFIYYTAPKEPLPKAKDLVVKTKKKVESVIEPIVEKTKEKKAEIEKEIESEVQQLLDMDPVAIKYVLVGSGPSSFSAIKGIRKNDEHGEIVMISEESDLPYQKPPLSKELWLTGNDDMEFKDWQGQNASVFYKSADYYKEQHVDMELGRKVVAIDAEKQIVTLDSGKRYKYDKLLISTGSQPNMLPNVQSNLVSTYRTLKDYKHLSQLAKNNKEIVVIGGGFLGSELAVGLSQKGAKVHQVYPESGNLGLVLPDYLSEFCKKQVEALNVKVSSNSKVKDISSSNDKVNIELDNGETIQADHCVVCIGAKPNIEMVDQSGFEIDKNGGLLVNQELMARSNIYASGDCISFYDPVLGRRRTEHYDHAIQSGYHAGLNMTGLQKAYTYQPMYWSDIGPNVSFEAVGILSNKLQTKSFWNLSDKNEFDKGVVFYVDGSKIGSFN